MSHLSFRTFVGFLSLLCCLHITFPVHLSDAKCGFPKARSILDRSLRVVGGSEARKGSHPWLVSLRIRGSHFCAAAILTDHWLLTAAHCFANLPSDFLHIVEAVAGEFNQRKVDRGEQSFSVKTMKFHEKYQRFSPMSYDIALLEINGHIQFGDFIKPICLPYPGERFPPKTTCVVGGWGRIKERGLLPAVLQEVHLDLVEQSRCKHVMQNLRPGQKTFTVLCAGPEKGGRDACQGDSGGPLLCPRADGRWVAVGVTSWGKGCGRSWNNNRIKPSSRRGSPGVFTDVSMFLSWIKFSLRKGVDRSLCSVADGVVPGSEGMIRNPAHPDQSYNNNEICWWSIQVDAGQSTLLEFLKFDLENDALCQSDQLTVYVGEDRRIGRFCSSQQPSSILIYGSHSVTVQFVSDVSSTGAGFTMQFSGVGENYSFGAECGTMVLLQPDRVVQSPAYPQPYSNNTLCRWVIYAPEGHIVKLDFDDFDLEESENCRYDSITVFGDIDGEDEIVVVCGRSLPPAVLSYGHVMILQFSTDSSVSARGFNASVSFISKKAPSGMPDVFALSELDVLGRGEDDGNVPWLCHMSISLGASHHCSGVIIQSTWILTAALCVYDLEERFVSVRTGGSKEQAHDVRKVIIHPQFNSSSLDYNVALLQLSFPLTLSHSMQPVCLPSTGQEIPPSLHCWAWRSQMSGQKHVQLKISVLEGTMCEQCIRRRLTCTMLYAGLTELESTETCMTQWNNSGGPLVCLTNTSGIVLMGVQSWGEPCGGIQKPALYSSLPALMQWVSQHLDTE